MLPTRRPRTKKDNPTPPTREKHTFYFGNKGNQAFYQPWGQCTCGITLEDPHLIVEHIDKHNAYVNNDNAYTILKYMIQEGA